MTYVFYHSKCIRVIDGDTFEVEIDKGHNQFYRTTVRLHGVDTPEIRNTREDNDLSHIAHKKHGKEAKKFVEEAILNKPIILTSVKPRDKYGRYLAHVEYFDGDHETPLHLASELISNNLYKKKTY